MHETGFAQSWSIGASLGLKIFHRAPVVCGEFSRMLISRSPRVRLIMQSSILVKLPDFIFGIQNKYIIDANSHLTSVGKHGAKPSATFAKPQVRRGHSLPLNTFWCDVTIFCRCHVTSNTTCVIKIMRKSRTPKRMIP